MASGVIWGLIGKIAKCISIRPLTLPFPGGRGPRGVQILAAAALQRLDVNHDAAQVADAREETPPDAPSSCGLQSWPWPPRAGSERRLATRRRRAARRCGADQWGIRVCDRFRPRPSGLASGQPVPPGPWPWRRRPVRDGKRSATGWARWCEGGETNSSKRWFPVGGSKIAMPEL